MINDLKRFTLRYPYELHELIKNDAEKLGISIGAMIKIILFKHYKKDKNK